MKGKKSVVDEFDVTARSPPRGAARCPFDAGPQTDYGHGMRGLVVPEAHEDFTADPVELFFDLAFVFAFSQLVGLLLYDPTWSTIGKAALIFLLLWLPWTQFAWSANAVPGNSRTVRLLFLVATAASVPMAASVQTAFDQSGAMFAIPVAVIFLAALALMVLGLDNSSEVYRSALRYGTPTLIAMTAIVVGGFLEDEARTTAWILGVLIFVWSTIRAGGSEWIIRAGHFAERHGLIIIIALGESIVALGLAASDEKHTAAVVTASVIGMVVVSAMWWLYFDVVAIAAERRLAQVTGATRNALARDSYSYLHALMILGIVFLALGLKQSVLDLGEPLKVIPSVALFGGVALYLVGHILFRLRNMGSLNTQRLLVTVLLVAAIPIGVAVPAYVSLIMLLALLLGLIGYESVAYRDARHRLRYH